jgi:hypothetical protein
MANVLLDHSLTTSTAAEGTYAVPGTLGGGLEWLESSKLDQDPAPIQGAGLRQGSKFDRADRRVPGISRVTGALNLEVVSKGLGKLFGYGFGTGVSTNVSGALYQELFTATTSTPVMPSFTVQEGIVALDGTIHAFTTAGCTVKSLELAQPQTGPMSVKFDIDGRYKHRLRSVTDSVTNSTTLLTSATANFGWNDIGRPISGTNIAAATTIAAVLSPTNITLSQVASGTGSGGTISIGTAYTAPTYPATPSIYSNALPAAGAVVIGGTYTAPTTTALASISSGITGVGLRSWTFQLDNGLDTKRDVVGGRNNPVTGKRKGTLTMVWEYDSVTGAYLADAQASQQDLPIILTSTTTEQITTGNPATAQLSAAVINLDSGAFPQPTKGDTTVTTVKATILDGLVAGQACYFAMRTADTAL